MSELRQHADARVGQTDAEFLQVRRALRSGSPVASRLGIASMASSAGVGGNRKYQERRGSGDVVPRVTASVPAASSRLENVREVFSAKDQSMFGFGQQRWALARRGSHFFSRHRQRGVCLESVGSTARSLERGRGHAIFERLCLERFYF